MFKLIRHIRKNLIHYTAITLMITSLKFTTDHNVIAALIIWLTITCIGFGITQAQEVFNGVKN